MTPLATRVRAVICTEPTSGGPAMRAEKVIDKIVEGRRPSCRKAEKCECSREAASPSPLLEV